MYWITMSVLLHSNSKWQANKLAHLRRLIVLAHTRHCQHVGPCKSLDDRETKDYSVYKPYLIFFGIIDGIYNCFFKVSWAVRNGSGGLNDFLFLERGRYGRTVADESCRLRTTQ